MPKSPESEPINIEEEELSEKKDESGYSEKKQAKIIESQFDLHQQKRNASVKVINQKKLTEYHDLTAKISNLMNQYSLLIKDDLHRAKKLLSEINELENERREIFKNLTE